MEEKDLKYQKEIDKLIDLGYQLPKLHAPENRPACRFVFSQLSRQNHIPQYMSNPKRMLQDIEKGNATTSLLSLSCFDSSSHAESFYINLQKAFRNISTSIGDSLAEGLLRNEDGLMTQIARNGHFDFYEFEGCDLNTTFLITKTLAQL